MEDMEKRLTKQPATHNRGGRSSAPHKKNITEMKINQCRQESGEGGKL